MLILRILGMMFAGGYIFLVVPRWHHKSSSANFGIEVAQGLRNPLKKRADISEVIITLQ